MQIRQFLQAEKSGDAQANVEYPSEADPSEIDGFSEMPSEPETSSHAGQFGSFDFLDSPAPSQSIASGSRASWDFLADRNLFSFGTVTAGSCLSTASVEKLWDIQLRPNIVSFLKELETYPGNDGATEVTTAEDAVDDDAVRIMINVCATADSFQTAESWAQRNLPLAVNSVEEACAQLKYASQSQPAAGTRGNSKVDMAAKRNPFR